MLIPQFLIMFKRQKYDMWVLAFTLLAGSESLTRNLPLLAEYQTSLQENPYGGCSA